jgi:hypothetical protein
VPAERPSWAESRSIFVALSEQVYHYTYQATLAVSVLRGGVPSDPKVAEGWIRSKFQAKDHVIRELVQQVIAERKVPVPGGERSATVDEAIAEVADQRTLNGFKRDPDGQLCIEGRQVKAMIKEAANIRWAKGRWGATAKGTKAWFAEHVFVPEDKIAVRSADGTPLTEPDGVAQDFVHARFGAAIKLAEFVENVHVSFLVKADWDLDAERAKEGEGPRSWGHLWVTAEQQGIGADRSQGFGTFKVVAWDRA